ncbi:MAG: hypothetical protein J2P54_20885 [Bradyrhizobiaceae bacterium]|nr:hypothetical protein [Bradyrhizobiaceae bacterium]
MVEAIKPFLLPGPSLIFDPLRSEFVSRELLIEVQGTLLRMFAGYGIAIAIGVPFGIFLAPGAPGALVLRSVALDRAAPQPDLAREGRGVLAERIRSGKPQQSGRLERFHLTLLQDGVAAGTDAAPTA